MTRLSLSGKNWKRESELQSWFSRWLKDGGWEKLSLGFGPCYCSCHFQGERGDLGKVFGEDGLLRKICVDEVFAGVRLSFQKYDVMGCGDLSFKGGFGGGLACELKLSRQKGFLLNQVSDSQKVFLARSSALCEVCGRGIGCRSCNLNSGSRRAGVRPSDSGSGRAGGRYVGSGAGLDLGGSGQNCGCLGGSAVGEILQHKISDSGLGVKPFDCFCLWRVPAWVVVGFDFGGVVCLPVAALF